MVDRLIHAKVKDNPPAHCPPSVHAAVLQPWRYMARETGSQFVLPDGCRDLIIRSKQGGPWYPEISNLDEQAYQVAMQRGDWLTGYRFQPAAVFDRQVLLHAVSRLAYPDADAVLAIIDDLVKVDMRTDEVLLALSQTASVAAATRAVGVSERTVERLIARQTGKSPSFWQALVRMRRCAKVLSIADSRHIGLVEIAALCGYADQAHMSREFRRWLGTTPAVFRDNPLLHQGMQPGYD